MPKEVKIEASDAPSTDYFGHFRSWLQYGLIDSAFLAAHQHSLVGSTVPIAEEEEMHASLGEDEVVRSMLMNTAKGTKELVSAVYSWLFDQFAIPRANGVEIGAGSVGHNLHMHLDGVVDHNTWIETDVSPSRLAMLKQNFPNANVAVASHFDLRLSTPPNVILGRNALLATNHIAEAIAAIRDNLAKHGVLVLVFENIPNASVIRRGVEQGRLSLPTTGMFIGKNRNSVVGVDTGLGLTAKPVLTQDLIRQEIARVIETTGGMELVFNSWITAHADSSDGKLYAFGMAPTPHGRDEISLATIVAKKA